MKTVNVERNDLLKQLVLNKDKHETEYKQMLINYKELIICMLKESLTNFDADICELPKWPPKPREHLAEYERAIVMLKMSVDNVIELTDIEFAELVMDQWGWKKEFEMTKTIYGL